MAIMKRASIFMILAQALIHFRPNPSYEKYVKFLAGIMTIVILVIPIMELFQDGAAERYDEYLLQYMERLQEISGEEAAADMDIEPSRTYIGMVEKEIKTKLNNYEFQDGYRVKSVEIQGILQDGNAAEEDCHIKIVLTSGGNHIAEVKIDQIKLQETTSENDDEQEQDGQEENKISKLRQELAGLLGTDEDQLEVEVIE